MSTASPARSASASRRTAETDITIELDVDGTGRTDCSTGLPFFDHMLDQLGRHGGMDLTVRATGDLEIDCAPHRRGHRHPPGRRCSGRRSATRRACVASPRSACPLDEAVVEAVLDLSGRPFLHYEIDPPGVKILGDPPFDPQLMEEFWRAVVDLGGSSRCTSRWCGGRNTHHIIEASVKAVARALRDAVRVEGTGVPSTKGVL